jgi:hypothetical protein
MNDILTGNCFSEKKNSGNTVKGYRPKSLLNVDYKLFSRIIKYRLEKLMPSIVSHQQAACNKNRNITFALCHIRDKLAELTYEKKDGTLISFDFDHSIFLPN